MEITDVFEAYASFWDLILQPAGLMEVNMNITLRKRTLGPVRLVLDDLSIRSFLLFVDVSLQLKFWRRIPTMALRPEGHGDSQGGLPDEWSK